MALSDYPNLDGETANRIMLDIGMDISPEESDVNYGPEERAFRKDVEEDLARQGEDVFLDVRD